MDAKQTLRWYIDMGIDEVIGEEPVNHLVRPQEAPKPAVIAPVIASPASVSYITPEPTPQRGFMDVATVPNLSEWIAKAREAADRCTTLAELRAAIEAFEGCDLKKTATNTVFADGNPDSDVMVIGEAPGANEDAEGIPFCGMSGQLLDKMLSYAGLIRAKNFYITNNLFWRPPGNRRPTPDELAMCSPFVEKHIALFNPKLMILAGSTATSSLLNAKQGITSLRGKFQTYSNRYTAAPVPVAVLFHPSYLLRQPSQKKNTWHDILMIKDYMAQQGIKV